MPHEHDEGATLHISPFGEHVWSQRGVRIRGPESLRAHLVAWPDSSVADMSEEELPMLFAKELRKLRRRFRDAY